MSDSRFESRLSRVETENLQIKMIYVHISVYFIETYHDVKSTFYISTFSTVYRLQTTDYNLHSTTVCVR